MKFYVSFIDKCNNHSFRGKYFNHAADAIRYAHNFKSCGYTTSIIAYNGTTIAKKVICKG